MGVGPSVYRIRVGEDLLGGETIGSYHKRRGDRNNAKNRANFHFECSHSVA